MLLGAAAFVSGLGVVFFVLDQAFKIYGLSIIGSGMIAFVGLEVSRTGLQQQTGNGCCLRTVQLGEIPVGFLIMLVGVTGMLISLERLRKAF